MAAKRSACINLDYKILGYAFSCDFIEHFSLEEQKSCLWQLLPIQSAGKKNCSREQGYAFQLWSVEAKKNRMGNGRTVSG